MRALTGRICLHMPLKLQRRSRFWSLLAVIATITVGLATRRFPGFVPDCFGKYPGDSLWALMVFFGWGIVFPGASSVRNAALALGVSYAVEVLKLYQAPWIVGLRQSTIGHLVFGHVFSWQNFIAYAVGVALGVVGEYLFLPKITSSASSGDTDVKM